jgi:hypothetical protein
MTEYSIRVTDDNRAVVTATLDALKDKITLKGQSGKYTVFETDQATADELAAKTGTEVDPVTYADIDMGMQESMMRVLQERSASLRGADAAIHRARLATVDPVDGQPADRYAIRTEDMMAIGASRMIAQNLEAAGVRPFQNGIDSLSVLFFDAADPQKVESIRSALPKNWTLQKLDRHAP